jgi:hypothetical protein
MAPYELASEPGNPAPSGHLEGNVHVSDATLAAPLPAEHSLRDIMVRPDTAPIAAAPVNERAEFEAAAEAPDWIVEPLWDRPAELAVTLVYPLRVFREVEGSEWRSAFALMGAAVVFRAIVYIIQADADPLPITGAVIGQVIGPLAYIGIVGALLLVLGALTHRLRASVAFSLAALSAAPIALRCVVQGIAMVFLGRGVSPTGIVGVFAPKAPATLLWLLGPLDVFGIWTLVLLGLVVYTVLAQADPQAD